MRKGELLRLTWDLVDMTHGFIRLKQTKNGKAPALPFNETLWSVVAGQCVSHFRYSRLISGLDVGSGLDTGKTLCMGSRQSDTYLRIYAKAAEQRAKGRPVEGSWIRWEMEWKAERATAVGTALSGLTQGQFHQYIVGVFRSALDFRNCTWADDPKDRYYAPLLDWWKVLTEGMQRARLEIAKSVKKIEDVKRWTERSLAPMLGLLCAHPESGERSLINRIVEGVERWRPEHMTLLGSGQEVRRLRQKMREWNPREDSLSRVSTRRLKAQDVRAAVNNHMLGVYFAVHYRCLMEVTK